jgi:hypothetical protein
MAYSVDFSSIGLDAYKNILKTTYLIPSHSVLLNGIDDAFDRLSKNGIRNLDDLQQALKNKQKISAFAKAAGIAEDYLTVLNREVCSRMPAPRSLSDYPDMPAHILDALKKQNIKTSAQFFDAYVGKTLPKDIPADATAALFTLSCLCRLRYVSPVFAYLLMAAGYDTLEKIAAANETLLYEKIRGTNAGGQYFKGNIGQKDVRFLIQDAVFFAANAKQA